MSIKKFIGFIKQLLYLLVNLPSIFITANLMRKRMYPKILNNSNELLDRKKDDLFGLRQKAYALFYLRENDYSRTAFIKLFSKHKLSEKSYQFFINNFIKNAWNGEDYEEVIDSCEKAINLISNQNIRKELYRYLSASYFKLGRFEEARDICEKALKEYDDRDFADYIRKYQIASSYKINIDN